MSQLNSIISQRRWGQFVALRLTEYLGYEVRLTLLPKDGDYFCFEAVVDNTLNLEDLGHSVRVSHLHTLNFEVHRDRVRQAFETNNTGSLSDQVMAAVNDLVQANANTCCDAVGGCCCE